MKHKIRHALQRSVDADIPRLAKLQEKTQHPVLDVYFKFAAKLGDEIVYTLMLPFALWNFESGFGRQLIGLWCFVFYVCHYIKDLLCLPRPHSPPVRRLETHYSEEYGFPSAHTSAATSLPFFIVAWMYRTIGLIPITIAALVVSVVYAVSVSLSRLYVGVHSQTDVWGGLVLGGGGLAAWLLVGDAVDAFLMHSMLALPTFAFLSVFLVAVYPPPRSLASFNLTMSVFATSIGVLSAVWVVEGAGATVLAPHLPAYYAMKFTPARDMLDVLLRVVVGLPLCLSVSSMSKMAAALVFGKPAAPVAAAAGAPVPPFQPFSAALGVRWAKYMTMGACVIVCRPVLVEASERMVALLGL